jgi:hypothetical protein
MMPLIGAGGRQRGEDVIALRDGSLIRVLPTWSLRPHGDPRGVPQYDAHGDASSDVVEIYTPGADQVGVYDPESDRMSIVPANPDLIDQFFQAVDSVEKSSNRGGAAHLRQHRLSVPRLDGVLACQRTTL